MIRLPSEWESHDAILFAWPDEQTDWAGTLIKARRTYLAIFEELLNYSPIVLIVREGIVDELNALFRELFTSRSNKIHLFVAEYNDTWARDFGPIGIETDGNAGFIDFIFNGWGNKFDAVLDNLLTTRLRFSGAFKSAVVTSSPMVLEGGAIDSNGDGCLLTTSACLLNRNRNPGLNKVTIEEALIDSLGVSKVLWLDHGYLAGDDTDCHVDTLARFTSVDTIVYVNCGDEADEHYPALLKMQEQLKGFHNQYNKPFTLIPLPWPQQILDEYGERLPATYANFLVSNGVVLMPVYDDENDDFALSQLAKAFPEHKVVGVNCLALLEQHGSLHCITMQLLKGSLNFERFI